MSVGFGYRPSGISPIAVGLDGLRGAPLIAPPQPMPGPPRPLPRAPFLPGGPMPGRLKSGFAFRITSSLRLCTAEAEEGAPIALPAYEPGPGRQLGLIPRCDTEVKCE